jgi:hypothetical protein
MLAVGPTPPKCSFQQRTQEFVRVREKRGVVTRQLQVLIASRS